MKYESSYDTFLRKYCRPDNAKFNKRRPITNPFTIDSYGKTLRLDYATVKSDAIKRYLKNKDYDTYYLITYWWYVISHMRKLMDDMECKNGCDVDKRTLQVHHLTYEHLGEEINYMDDLITVCPACHEAIHVEEELRTGVKRKKKKKRKPRKKKSVVTTRTDDFTVKSYPKKYVVTMKTHELSMEELRAGILNNIDIVLDVLK